MEFFALVDNIDDPSDRWFLGNIVAENSDDFWKYIKPGNVVCANEKQQVNVREKGRPLDFTMADFEILIVNEKVASIISGSNEVQLIPIKITGHDQAVHYILVVINEVQCLDESRSEFEKWEVGNDIRPDKAGQYRIVYKLVIDPAMVSGNNIFRLKNYNSMVIVSGKMKQELERSKVTGISFRNITE